MNLRRKAVLHIGWPKTGTTTIQNTLFRHRDELLKQHYILYPSIAANHTVSIHEMFEVGTQSSPPARIADTRNKGTHAERAARYFSAFAREFENETWQTILLSGEGMSNMHREHIIELRKWICKYVDSCEINVWVRHPVSWANSAIQQLLKGGQTLERMSEHPVLPLFRKKIKNWAEEFGYDTIRIVQFESAVASELGIVGTMVQSLNLGERYASQLARKARYDNEAISQEAALILSSLNRQRPLFAGRRLGLQRTGKELLSLRTIPGRKFAIDPETSRKIRRASRPDIEWLNATFGLSLYPDMLSDDVAVEAVGNGDSWGKATVDRVALLLSDCLNRDYAQHMIGKAQRALKRGDKKAALAGYREAYRACPENTAAKAQIEALRSQTTRERPSDTAPIKKFKLLIDEPRKSDHGS